MKKIFVKAIKDAGLKLEKYSFGRYNMYCVGWDISVSKGDEVKSWSGSYYIEKAESKKAMMADFNEFIEKLKS